MLKEQNNSNEYSHKNSLKFVVYLYPTMKKVLVIFLTIQFFTNHEAFAELVKLPFLFDHYNQTATNVSFIEFIQEHYTENQNKDVDHDHGKLPFKHSEDGCSHHPSPNISVVIKTENHYSLSLLEFKVQQSIISNDRIPCSFAESIWQPPKLA